MHPQAVALQTFLAVPLLLVAPAACVIGAGVLTKANDGTLVPFVSDFAAGLASKPAQAKAAAAPALRAVAGECIHLVQLGIPHADVSLHLVTLAFEAAVLLTALPSSDGCNCAEPCVRSLFQSAYA